MSKGRMMITGWLIGGVTLPVLNADGRSLADFLWLGVDLYQLTNQQELVLPPATVLVAAERGAFINRENRLIETGEWVRFTGEWTEYRVPDATTRSYILKRRQHEVRKRITNQFSAWLAAHPQPDRQWHTRVHQLEQENQAYRDGDLTFAQLQARQAAAFTRWYPGASRPFRRMQHAQQQTAIRAAQRLDAVAPRTYAFTNIKKMQIIEAVPAVLRAIPTYDRAELYDRYYRHELVAGLAAQQRARLASGEPLVTVATRPHMSGATWQSDGTLVPPNHVS